MRAHGVNAASVGGKVSTCGAGRLIEIRRVYGENGTVDHAMAIRPVRQDGPQQSGFQIFIRVHPAGGGLAGNARGVDGSGRCVGLLQSLD